jgi:hypothetical protein
MKIEELQKLPHSELIRHINYYKIPVYITGFTDEGARLFNGCLALAQEICGDRRIVRCDKGGISTKTRTPAYDVREKRTSVELTFISRYGGYRIQFRQELDFDKMSGTKAFKQFKKLLKMDGIDLDTYAVKKGLGLKYKEKIPKPLICLAKPSYKDQIFEGVHHIDFHSSYPAGLINTHSEFAPTIKRIYNRRKTDETCKAILNYSIGYMQSIECCGAIWSPLSKDAIEDNNIRLLNLATKVNESGRKVLLFNTDGFWYQGEIFHDEGEGEDIGQWHNDHINCRFRAKSDGAYEFIEDGDYYPVIRGIPNESKGDWEWGDIYTEKAETIDYLYFEGKGIVKNGEKI